MSIAPEKGRIAQKRSWEVGWRIPGKVAACGQCLLQDTGSTIHACIGSSTTQEVHGTCRDAKVSPCPSIPPQRDAHIRKQENHQHKGNCHEPCSRPGPKAHVSQHATLSCFACLMWSGSFDDCWESQHLNDQSKSGQGRCMQGG